MNKSLLALMLAATLITSACRRDEASQDAGIPETDTTATTVTETTNTTTGVGGGTVSNLPPDDKTFASVAGMSGLAEVQMGNLALQKASSADVKTYAQRMVTDHSTSNQELQQLATTKGVALPTELDAEHKAGMDHLTSLNGAEFDKAYMQHMVADHEKAVSEFERASTTLQDADLKGFAAKNLPILQQHLQLAKDVSAKVK